MRLRKSNETNAPTGRDQSSRRERVEEHCAPNSKQPETRPRKDAIRIFHL
jgi:hypothetical protein